MISDFRDSTPEYADEYIGHDVEMTDLGQGQIVRFVPGSPSWHANHEAWLFGQWLSEQGVEWTWSLVDETRDPRTIIIYEVDLPSWVTLISMTKHTYTIRALDKTVTCDDLDDGIEELRKHCWHSLLSVQNVGETILRRAEKEYETPFDVDWESIDGVGSTTAQRLEDAL